MKTRYKVVFASMGIIILYWLVFSSEHKKEYYLTEYNRIKDSIFYQTAIKDIKDSMRKWMEKDYYSYNHSGDMEVLQSKYLYFNRAKTECITMNYRITNKRTDKVTNSAEMVYLFKEGKGWKVYTYSLPIWYYFDDVIRGSNVTYQIQQYYDKYEDEFLDRIVPKYYKYFFCINENMFNYDEEQLLKKHNKLKYRHLK